MTSNPIIKLAVTAAENLADQADRDAEQIPDEILGYAAGKAQRVLGEEAAAHLSWELAPFATPSLDSPWRARADLTDHAFLLWTGEDGDERLEVVQTCPACEETARQRIESLDDLGSFFAYGPGIEAAR